MLCALAVEKIDGVPLRYADRPTRAEPRSSPSSGRILDRIHAAGVVHWDLRSIDNVLVTRAGDICRPRLRQRGLASSRKSQLIGLLFRWFQKIDESAYLKWKQILGAGPYSDREIHAPKRHSFWRSLWVFNPATARGRHASARDGGVG